ncbi:MAG: HAD family phosphatase [Verrucomicrobiae bacterium]|nr:HAD family phosphatase [Verrucomicrobiae bacterium]
MTDGAFEEPSVGRFGAVFDLDGVLIDSHDQHQRSWFLLADQLGLPLTTEQFKISFGMRNEQVIPQVFRWAEEADKDRIRELGDRKEALYRELLKAEGLDPLPGVVAFLQSLRDAGVPASVGSSTPRLNIEVCLEITGLSKFFSEAFVGAEDVSKGKPEPEVFLKAAGRIDRDPALCFVVEDAHVGIQAGKRAGMKTIAVTTTHPAASFSGESSADLIVPTLLDVRLDRVWSWFQASP